jgi:DNA polymerase I-like protein with 3'-5' exonuclease and polymerase domains
MRLVLDVENTTQKREGKLFLDPWEPDNHLVNVGVRDVDDGTECLTFDLQHKEYVDQSGIEAKRIQKVLDHATLLIMHNAQHDLAWLWECGFKYDGPIWDTMLAESILLRGNNLEITPNGVAKKISMSLGNTAIRRNLYFQKDDTLKRYFKQGYNTDEIPLAELTFYLEADCNTTTALFHEQAKDFADPESESLIKVRDITFEVCKLLTRMKQSGMKVDREELDSVRKEFEEERGAIQSRLQMQVRKVMGDTPVNLNSPEQMSQVIFSRKPHSKDDWPNLFDDCKNLAILKDIVNANSDLLYRTEAYTCPTCKGDSETYKIKKDGSKFAKPTKCKDCLARGYKLKKQSGMAGFGFFPPSASWVSASGFSTGKNILDVLRATALDNKMDEAVKFLGDLKRLNAVSSYLSSFVDGIDTFTKPDDILHVSLTQHITSTGRFSGREPNMQNMPRGGTFPVKRVFISRWDGGKLMEADFAQLEFRVAAFLSQDSVAMEEINTGFDVHSYTSKVISDAGQSTTRQEAKAHTFAPLFGATGHGRTKAESAYYHHFLEKYQGIKVWHKKLGDEAIRLQKITTASGRQYAFPNTWRQKNGNPTNFTRIKNYPVQGFATGDVVPVVLLEIDSRLKDLQSCLVNSVHDSAVIDIHPNEEKEVLSVISDINKNLDLIIHKYYGVEMNVPLLLEAKVGPNWLDTKDV